MGTEPAPDLPGAAILAGGKSRRMGTNKALLRLREGGPTLIETVAERLREAGLEPGLVVTNNPEEYAFLGLPVARDIVPDGGPLAGILTVLLSMDRPRVFVVACDMPLLSPEVIGYMARLPADYDALVPRWTGEDGTEWVESLHAIYSRRCIEPLRRTLAEGRNKASAFLAEVDTRYVEGAELRPLDPDLSCFLNLNRPQDLEAIRNYEL